MKIITDSQELFDYLSVRDGHPELMNLYAKVGQGKILFDEFRRLRELPMRGESDWMKGIKAYAVEGRRTGEYDRVKFEAFMDDLVLKHVLNFFRATFVVRIETVVRYLVAANYFDELDLDDYSTYRLFSWGFGRDQWLNEEDESKFKVTYKHHDRYYNSDMEVDVCFPTECLFSDDYLASIIKK